MTVVEDFPSDMQSVICNEQRFMKPTKASPLDYQCNQWCNVPDCVKDKVACSQSLKICAMLNGCAMYVLYMTRARRQALLDTRHIGTRQMSFATRVPRSSTIPYCPILSCHPSAFGFTSSSAISLLFFCAVLFPPCSRSPFFRASQSLSKARFDYVGVSTQNWAERQEVDVFRRG
jgi:hypothetical protein